MTIGIDKIGFFAPNLYVDLAELALERNIDPNKYIIGIGQNKMAVAPLSQDAVTLGANAAADLLNDRDKNAIDLVIFATESGLDYSKACSVYVHNLLNINPRARCIEMKQACYSTTAAIQLAKNHIQLHPDKKALIIASDISRYGLNTSGEPTQGAGAIALLISQNPRIAVIEDDAAYYTDDIMDFWRPHYSDVAIVDGQYSNDQYQKFFQTVYNDYREQTQRTLDDFAAICLHIPYSKIGYKTLKLIGDETTQSALFENYRLSTLYNREVGNIYTASLYLSLLSLLENGKLNGNDRIGLYSYGSGAVAEFFSIRLTDNYKNSLNHTTQKLLNQRQKLSIPEYEALFSSAPEPSTVIAKADTDRSLFFLNQIHEHKRLYQKQR